jgi:hypothetical protein
MAAVRPLIPPPTTRILWVSVLAMLILLGYLE